MGSWGCCSALLPAGGCCPPLGSRPLFPRCVRSPLCGPGRDSEGSGALSSRLPRRHLTRHGEVWVDEGSPQPFLAAVCSELDLRLAEKTKQQRNFCFLLGCHFFFWREGVLVV